ncbi:alpha-D-ribose 1-methylphosphonate 5-triphosphate diphosphatase [Vineibacter terrae]|uniref:Alpha-D-ribose 1-methylphosphonate 5-triphosphate diphosphatase n=1 Tax=Vineibacter terrae TaxID=2586908 RepID=A0A5C8PUM0_9HYPH|nr:alpha-D-ribose 1-methylphosphonate 5-triphosphate diphosphatase [Vineibacter terrae]TXL81663.1 alpha-D-ribose 1-methylphosphonate 5-triphosphate diphosphatase [Vineibacter terrae]
MQQRWRIVGVHALVDDGLAADTALGIDGDVIADIDAPAAGVRELRFDGLLALPGIIDLHGDAFERQLMPRPGVFFADDLALLDTDRQLAANGVTTAYHGLTWSWEPGLRGTERAHAMAEALDRLRPQLACDTRLHLRWETYNLDVVPDVMQWLDAGRIHLLAFNDHTPPMLARLDDAATLLKYAERGGTTVTAFRDLLRSVGARHGAVPAAIATLAGHAGRLGVPLASHDDETPAQRAALHALGCTLCEFPKNRETAQAARATGDHVLMGAPNVVRGGSHLGGVSAAALIGDGICDVLTSDYYYPALLHAPFRLARDHGSDVGRFWPLVSAQPARAAGLRDRGTLQPGRRADLILVDARDGQWPRVVATVVAGRIVHHDRRADTLAA